MSSPAVQIEGQKPRVLVPLRHRWYIYGHSTIDADGRKSGVLPIRKMIRNFRSRTHIYPMMGAEDGSKLLYSLPLDFDFDRADPKWKKREKLDYKAMQAFITQRYPTLGRYLCTWTRSTGGKGLGVALWFDPILMNEKSFGAQFLARRVQWLIIEVLNSYGMGLDPGALGLERAMPNWNNGRVRLLKDEVTIRRVQRENEPHQVLRVVYNELRRADIFKVPKRKDSVEKGQRFAVKKSADEGLGKIYAHVLDSEPETLAMTTNYEELAAVSGLSVPTLRRHLTAAPWLKLSSVYGEGLSLQLLPTADLTERALSGRPEPKYSRAQTSTAEDWHLPEPESVFDLYRNEYLWRKSILLREEGYALDEAISILQELVSRIPGANSSRNCRRFKEIAASIYRCKRVERKSKRKIFPLEALAEPQSYWPWFPSSARLSVKSDEKGQSCHSCAPLSNFENGNDPFRKGGEGDLPPAGIEAGRATEGEAYSQCENVLLSAHAAGGPSTSKVLFAQERRSKGANNRADGKVLKIEAFKMGGQINEAGFIRGKVFNIIREARAAVCKDRHPIERLERALHRLGNDLSDEQVLKFLAEEHFKLRKTKDRGLRYKPPEGRYKRLAEAWAFLSASLRDEFLYASE